MKRQLMGILCITALSACSAPRLNNPHPDAFSSVFRQTAQQRPMPARDQGEVSLGLRLFFEPKLSANNAMSCASCHQPGRGFSNAEPNALGVTGQRGNRNVPTVYGMDSYTSFFWDGRAATLEAQALGPIQNPIEMNETLERAVAKLEATPYYRARFREVFGTPVTADGIARAIAGFERALALKPSRYDRFVNGDMDALNQTEINGMGLFGRQAHCSTCHKGVGFTDNKFHNIGVGFDRPNPDPGRQAVSGDPADFGAFRTPSLHQLSQTGPYMHDGSQRTLEEVMDYYDKGGHPNPNLSQEMNPLHLSPKQKAELVAFMHALQSPGDNLKELAQLPGVTLPGEPVPPVLRAARGR
ncbi:MAG: cytochrome-c peroxidase [Candidatus Sericytochromatia bacterium]